MYEKTRFYIVSFILVSCEEKKNVLIIGDSISIGYTPFVREALKTEANVFHNYRNARHTAYGLDSIANWLGETKWDVIHFNFGLHDLCYRSKNVLRDKVNGKLSVSLEDYGDNLRKIAEIIKNTDAKVIFATTTMVPENEPGRFSNDVEEYNQVAIEVMNDYDIEIDDLYSLSLEVHPRLGKGDDDVHYTKDGYRKLSEQVVKCIKEKL